MNTKDTGRNAGVRYEPNEKPPVLLSLGLGLQLAVLCVAGVVLTPAIVIRAAGGTEAFLSWAVFAAVAVSGISTFVPNTTYSTSISVTELTGVGARRVGMAVGAVFMGMAFLPKALAVLLAIPGPVAAAYITVLMAMLFVIGMKIVVQDGIDYRKGLVAGVAFWIGAGFQNGGIFPEYFKEDGGAVLELIASSRDEQNLQDRIALLGQYPEGPPVEREISLRLLRHVASSIRHQQYHDTDIVTIRVKAPEPAVRQPSGIGSRKAG